MPQQRGPESARTAQSPAPGRACVDLTGQVPRPCRRGARRTPDARRATRPSRRELPSGRAARRAAARSRLPSVSWTTSANVGSGCTRSRQITASEPSSPPVISNGAAVSVAHQLPDGRGQRAVRRRRCGGGCRVRAPGHSAAPATPTASAAAAATSDTRVRRRRPARAITSSNGGGTARSPTSSASSRNAVSVGSDMAFLLPWWWSRSTSSSTASRARPRDSQALTVPTETPSVVATSCTGQVGQVVQRDRLTLSGRQRAQGGQQREPVGGQVVVRRPVHESRDSAPAAASPAASGSGQC